MSESIDSLVEAIRENNKTQLRLAKAIEKNNQVVGQLADNVELMAAATTQLIEMVVQQFEEGQEENPRSEYL